MDSRLFSRHSGRVQDKVSVDWWRIAFSKGLRVRWRLQTCALAAVSGHRNKNIQEELVGRLRPLGGHGVLRTDINFQDTAQLFN
jgi:hypothetical protein